MTLTNSTRLGSYEIRSRLGAGGMGEVYGAGYPTQASRWIHAPQEGLEL